tara:strand:+ start:471 stop:662 length:192 start_codon:yes stop_codon:yes gene_type:complete
MNQLFLIEEIIAELKRDIATNNLLTLRETLGILLQDKDNKHILTRYLSEFPELREEYKDKHNE